MNGEQSSIKCPFCHTRLGADLSHCISCGRVVPEFFSQQQRRGFGQKPPLKFGGFWRRTGAFFIDYAVIFIGWYALLLPTESLPDYAFWLISVGWIVGYWIIFYVWRSATIGMMIYGLWVTDARKLQRLKIGRAIGRALAWFVSLLTILLTGFGFWMAAIPPKKRALHDVIAGTVVLAKRNRHPGWTVVTTILAVGVIIFSWFSIDSGPLYEEYPEYFPFLPQQETEMLQSIDDHLDNRDSFLPNMMDRVDEIDITQYNQNIDLALPNGSAKNKDAKEIIKEFGPAVVFIAGESEYGDPFFGSGFVVSPDGIGVTNHHVFEDGAKAAIATIDGSIYDIEAILDYDIDLDIAIFKIDGTDLPTIPMADSDVVEIGEEVVALGNPEGFTNSISDGIVSAVRDFEEEGHKIQVTAPISSGSSGGPLLNMAGEVIAITQLTFVWGQNLNFGIPINYVRDMLSDVHG